LASSADTVNGDERTAEPFRASDFGEMNKLRKLPAEKVPAGYCLVFGDNRNQSFDSRFWGLQPLSGVTGRARL